MRIAPMIAAVSAAALLFVSGCASPGVSAVGDEQALANLQSASGEAEVVAVAMHADWCGACQTLGPRVVGAAQSINDTRLRVVKADMTDTRNPAGARTLENMGLGALVESNGGKTGIVYIIDAETGEVLDTVAGTGPSEADIAAKFTAAIAAAS